MTQVENDPRPSLEQRVATHIDQITDQFQKAHYAYTSGSASFKGLTFREYGDDTTLTYLLDQASGLLLKLDSSAGGYATRFGVSTWSEVSSPAAEKTIVELDHTWPATYDTYIGQGDARVDDESKKETILAYHELVMQLFATDMARKAVHARRTAKKELSELLHRTRPLEVDEAVYFTHQE